MAINYKRISYFSLSALLLLSFSIILIPLEGSAEEKEEGIKITLKDGKFNPQEIRVKAGKKIKLIVTNSDKSAIEFESADLDREKVVRPGQSITVLLPKLEPGTYEFFDHFHPNTPRGKIIVE